MEQEHEEKKHSSPVDYKKEAQKRLEKLWILEKRIEDEEKNLNGGKNTVCSSILEEVRVLKNAIALTVSDPYHEILHYKFYQSKTDEEIAELLHCDSSTIKRNRIRLLLMITVYLYGY